MTTTLAPPASDVTELEPLDVLDAGEESADGDAHGDPPARLGAVALSALLACSAAAWLSGGLIRGVLPELISLGGVLLGIGLTYLSFRVGRPVLQYAVVPVAAVVGGILIAPQARGGTAVLPQLVREAISGGGLLQPPIPFDPGWRFILVVLFAIVATAALSTAVALGRPKLAVLVPLPVTVGAAVLQPQGNDILGSSVAIVLLLAGLAVAYGATLTPEETKDLSRSFELRRLARGMAMLLAVVVGIVALAQTQLLFPSSNKQHVIPPRRPPNVPIEKDRELFTVGSGFRGPLRLGVLDEYDGTAWLLPSEDPSRLADLADGKLPASSVPTKLRGAAASEVAVHIVDMRGLALPVPGLLTGLKGTHGRVQYDPRTSVPRLQSRLPQGYDYTALMAPQPTAAELNAAPPDVTAVGPAYLRIPPAPPAVVALLAKAPTDRFSRLQFLRDELYKRVILLGGGGPVDVSPQRVAELLQPGAKATPYEVVAAEAMLSRWAGVPGRIGYGYFGGDPKGSGYSFRPKHGRAWLESYFSGYGWVPLVGTPPRAAASLSQDTKLQDPTVKPSNDLAVIVYLPVEHRSLLLLFEVVRYWLGVALPIALGLGALLLLYPIGLKAVRRSRRRRWGRSHGLLGRVLVAYAEFRDVCSDLNIGDVRDSPLAFAEAFAVDAEHEELAWLVTRLFWGDLRRDLREEDVRAAQTMLGSVQARVLGAQAYSNRRLAQVSRTSLRDPFNDDIPNFYPRPLRALRGVLDVRRHLRRTRSLLSVRSLRLSASTPVLVVVMAVLLGGCGNVGGGGALPVTAAYPDRLTPEGFLGLHYQREPLAEKKFAHLAADVLVTKGQVYTIREGATVQGSMEVAVFQHRVDAREPAVQTQVERGLGGGFSTERFGIMRIRVAQRSSQRMYLWFPPENDVMVLLVFRDEYKQSDRAVLGTVAYIKGLDLDRVAPALELKG